jgi:hypothetical protein
MSNLIYKSLKETDYGKYLELELGIHRAQLEDHPDIGQFSMFYEMDEKVWVETYYSYENVEEDLKNALWEWYCSLSRLTNPNWKRILGSKRLAESF